MLRRRRSASSIVDDNNYYHRIRRHQDHEGHNPNHPPQQTSLKIEVPLGSPSSGKLLFPSPVKFHHVTWKLSFCWTRGKISPRGFSSGGSSANLSTNNHHHHHHSADPHYFTTIARHPNEASPTPLRKDGGGRVTRFNKFCHWIPTNSTRSH